MTKDKLKFKESNIDQQCYICEERSHTMRYCPQVFYSPNKNLVISKYNFSLTHETRKYYKRKHK